MFSQRLTKSIAIGATVIAIGGGAYGIVSATASTGSGSSTTASSTYAIAAQHIPGSGDRTLGLDRPQADQSAR
jgi:hypothetical protein